MQILQNTQPIVEFNKTIPSLQNQLNKTSEEIDGYLHFMSEIVYVRNENETKENALKRALNMLDRMLDIEKRRKILKENCDETMKFIDDMKLKLEETKKNCENDEDNIVDAKNETIDEIVLLQEMIMKEKIAPYQEKIDNYRKEFEENKKKLLGEKGESKEERRIRKEKERIR